MKSCTGLSEAKQEDDLIAWLTEQASILEIAGIVTIRAKVGEPNMLRQVIDALKEPVAAPGSAP